jgi:hypothetical protein
MKYLLLTLLLLSPAARAAGPGSNSFDFLTLDVGPRQTAMGGAGVAVADDLMGSNQNPAALGRLWRQEASFLHASWLQDVSYNYLGYAYPTQTRGTFAGSLLSLDYGSIQGYDQSGNQTNTLSAGDKMATAAYGREIASHLWAGGNLKYIQENLDSVSARTFGVDGGLLYAPPLSGWLSGSSVGLAVKNLGPSAKFDQESSALPRTIDAGVAFRPFFEGLTVAFDLTNSQAQAVTEKFGVEYWAKNTVAFRAGYDSAYGIGNGLGLGFGIKVKDVQVDYAFAALGDLGATSHFSLTYRFGSVAENYYEAGMRYMRQEDYAKAIVEFSKVLGEDPQHQRAIMRIKEANEKLQAQMSQLKE